MQLSDLPAWFAKRFGADATGPYIRTVPTTTADPNAASLSLGFPPSTFTNIGAGGSPMDGRDLNGIINAVSAWSQWSGLGGPAPWSSTISAAAGGYPRDSVVASVTVPGRQYMSTTNNNVTNPDTGGAGWRILVTQAATAGETTTGTSDERVITPLRLAGRLASLSFVTPAQLASAIAAAIGSRGTNANGWWSIESNGMIRQGGSLRATIGEGSFPITFPIAFPTACVNLTPVGFNASASGVQDTWMQRGPSTLTSAVIQVQYGSGGGGGINQLDGFDWEAVGY